MIKKEKIAIYSEKVKKNAVFDATIHLVFESGFPACTAAKIAENAGIGVGTIYRNFKNKDQIFDDLFQYIEEKMNKAIVKGFDLEKPVKDQFALICDNLIHYSLKNPKYSIYFDLYIDSSYGTTLRLVKRSKDGDNIPKMTLLYPFFKLFDQAKEQRIIKDLPNSLLFTLLYGALSHYIRDVHRGLVDSNEKIEKKVVETCWDMIKK